METQNPDDRRLMRSRTDRVLTGVCGGIGRHLNVDPIIIRIAFVVLVFAGGAGLIGYLAALLFIPAEPVEGGPPPSPIIGGDNRTLTIVGVVLLLLFTWPILLGGGFLIGGLAIPLAIFGALGLLAWLLVSGRGVGEGPGQIAGHAAIGLGVLALCTLVFAGGGWAAGIGGGAVAAGLVIAAGLVLLVTAFTGGVRWLLLPALSLALGVGFVSAAGIDLDGGVGEREYRPLAATDLRSDYELGIGELVLDLRQADLPAGDTPVHLRVGMGEATLLVPRDVCVASSATVGIGAVEIFDRDSGGIDMDLEDGRRAPAGTSRLVVDADIGVGAFQVRHEDRRDRLGEHSPFEEGRDGFFDDFGGGRPGNEACSGTETAGGGGA